MEGAEGRQRLRDHVRLDRPGVSTLAFWVAQQILDGKEVPKDLTVPFLRIDQDNLEANLANTEAGGVANVEYTLEDAQKVISGGRRAPEGRA